MPNECPVCKKGRLRRKRAHEEMFGVDLGEFDATVCDSCGETLLSSEAMDELEVRAKKLGVWGLATKVKVVKSGNSLVIRVPAALARYLKIELGQEVLLTPERDNRLVVELT